MVHFLTTIVVLPLPLVMKNLLLALLILSLGFTSCDKKDPVPLTKDQIKQKIDSLTTMRMRESDQQARQDLDYRMKIEVKVKVDSILNTIKLQTTKDTAAKPKNAAGVPVNK